MSSATIARNGHARLAKLLLVAIFFAILSLFSSSPVFSATSYFLRDDATGGSCSQIGVWDPGTKTCTLSNDMNNGIEIADNGLTLDGNGHTIYGPGSSYWPNYYGVYLSGKSGVTVRNVTLRNFYTGIKLVSSSQNVITTNICSNNSEGLLVDQGSNDNQISANSLTNNWNGLDVNLSNGNQLTGNSVSGSNSLGIYLHSAGGNHLTDNHSWNNASGMVLNAAGPDNSLSGNNMEGNTSNFSVEGAVDADFANDIDTSNLTAGSPILYVRDAVDQLYDASTNAGTFFCIHCDGVTIRDLTPAGNHSGIYLWNTTNSRIENINSTANSNGILLNYSQGNIISGGASGRDGMGIGLYNSDGNQISSRTFNGSYNAIWVENSGNNNISANTISDSRQNGISLRYLKSGANNISGNHINGSTLYGIWMAGGSGNTLRDNLMTGSKYNFWLDGSNATDFDQDIDVSNLVDGKPVYYVRDASGLSYGAETNAGVFYCISCNGVTISDLTLQHNGNGVRLVNSNNMQIKNIEANYTIAGIELQGSSGNIITGSSMENNESGIWMLYSSDNNTATGNMVRNNQTGIYIYYYSTGNLFYRNNIISNSAQTNIIYHSDGNSFSQPSPAGGNYWSNWKSPDANNDGFVDTPLSFTGGQDNLPWARPYGWWCGKPGLNLYVGSVYWSSFYDYIYDRLSVAFIITNDGPPASSLKIEQIVVSNGVVADAAFPVSLADIPASGRVYATVTYVIPQGVNSFSTRVYASAVDPCNERFEYPGQ